MRLKTRIIFLVVAGLVAFVAIVFWSRRTQQDLMNKQDVERVLNTEDNFSLCDRVYCIAADLTDNKINWEAEPEPLRTVSLVWTTHGIVGNGGFTYLLEHTYGGDAGFKLAADAFKRLGATEAYQAFEMCFNLFPDGRIPDGHDRRFAIFLKVPEEQRDALDAKFYKITDEELSLRLAEFIRSHKKEIAQQLLR